MWKNWKVYLSGNMKIKIIYGQRWRQVVNVNIYCIFLFIGQVMFCVEKYMRNCVDVVYFKLNNINIS